MGITDRFKDFTDKARELAAEHADQVDQGVEKAGDLADERTGGQHSEKIEQGVDKAQDALRNWAE